MASLVEMACFMNARDAWLATLGQLQVQLNRATYDTWLRRAELLAYEDGRFVVTVPNAYARDWIECHLLESMTQTLSRIFGRAAEIQVIVWEPSSVEDGAGPLLDAVRTTPTPDPPDSPAANLNPSYTFEAFIVGEANRYACLLAQAVTEGQIGRYSPVYFYGEIGVGKTHLLQAIAHGLIARAYSVVYLTAEDFTTELVAAIREHRNLEFREKFRLADAVIIDDLQFVEGKESTQAELIAVWDALRNRQRAMIFAANRLPRDLARVSRDARSRFQAGPIAAIEPPDPALRRGIAEAKAARRGFYLPPDVSELLAGRITASVRDLESAVEQIHTYMALMKLTAREAADRVLKSLGMARPAAVTLEQVIEAIAAYYDLTPDDLASRSRNRIIAHARQLAMYLARELTDVSLPQIGEALGGRSHSTILHGCAKIGEMMAADRAYALEVAEVRALCSAVEGQKSF